MALPTALHRVIEELKSRCSDLEECNRLRIAIFERLKYLNSCHPGADEINKLNDWEIKLSWHTQRIAGEIMKLGEKAERLGLSSEELSRLKWNHHLENWKAAQKMQVTELPQADFWWRVESFLDKLDAERRPPNSMAPPITGVGINHARSEAGVQAALAQGLSLSKGRNGIRVKHGFTDEQLRNSYKSLSDDLAEVRIVVIQRKGKISVSELKKEFKNRKLSKAADDKHWADWIEDFWEKKVRAKALTLVHLENITGVPRETLKTRLSR